MGVKLNPFTGKLDVVDSPSGDFSTVELNQGTQTNPSIVFDGSGTNTGLYSPGTGQVAISTSGTGRLFISDDGKVGIGVSDPSNYNISADDLVIADPNGFNSGISINITDNTGSSNIWFGDSDGEGRGQISYGHSTSDSMGFWVGGAQNLALYETGALAHIGGGSVITPAVSFNGSAPSNSLVIDSTGKVGLGTSTPQTLFELAADNATGGNNTLRFNDTDGTTQIGQQVGAIEFFSNDTIGGSGVIGKIECYSAGTTGNGVIGFKTGYATTLDTRLTIDHLGNVGIGTTSPGAKLHVEGATAGGAGVEYFDALQLENTQTANVGATRLKLKSNRGGVAGETSIAHVPYDGSGTAYLRLQSYQYQFYNQAGSSEYARIDSSGRLLVGTSSSTTASHLVIAGTSSGDAYGIARICSTSSTPGNGDLLGLLSFGDSSHTNAAWVRAERDGGTWTSGSSMPGRLVFSTTADSASSPTERMRITSGGRITLGSDASGLLGGSATTSYIVAPAAAANTGSVGIEGVTVSTSTRYHQSFSNPNGVVGSISTNGSATAFNTSSDYRLKENVVDITDGITRVKQLQPRRFNFIADADTTVDGFIAHEAQDVVPECVTGTKDEVDDEGNPVYQGIDQAKLVPLLTAALQEALGRIETLEAEVAALKAQ